MDKAGIEILMIEDNLADAELATRAFLKNRPVNGIRVTPSAEKVFSET